MFRINTYCDTVNVLRRQVDHGGSISVNQTAEDLLRDHVWAWHSPVQWR